jgi:two-component system NtrC family sensor kinase
MMPDRSDILRSKAMLVLRLEREVYTLRQARARTETWLRAFQDLSEDLRPGHGGMLLDRWVSAMVNRLGFQIAAAYAVDPNVKLALRAGRAHHDLPAALPSDPALDAHCSATVAGRFPSVADQALTGFAQALDLESFHWFAFPSLSQRVLLVAGFSQAASGFHQESDHDHGHFVSFGTHIGALVNNVALIGQLDQERSELHTANRNLDRSLAELTSAQRQLLESSQKLADVSRRAGMADIATGVLHNVGNTMNSVNVAVQTTVERVKALPIAGLGNVVGLLEAENFAERGQVDPIRAGQIVAYLKLLHTHFCDGRDSIQEELETTNQSVNHVNWIVSKQQAYAKTEGFSEQCNVSELVDDALGLTGASLSQLDIAVVRDFQPAPPVRIDRHKALQILVNLLSNARHALADSDTSARRIVARIRHTESKVRICVEDNGIGIDRRHLSRLFTHGFTTRRNGHGFGLHTSALAAQELHGALTGTSDGPGRGACFVLELPTINEAQPSDAAENAPSRDAR